MSKIQSLAYLPLASLLLMMGNLNLQAQQVNDMPSATPANPLSARESAIINNPTIVAIARLLNEKYQGSCTAPSAAADIRWFCTGAILEVERPSLVESGCGFEAKVICPREIAKISGDISHFELAMPASAASLVVAPTIEIIDISSIEFQPRNTQ